MNSVSIHPSRVIDALIDNTMEGVMPECLGESGKASHGSQNGDGEDEFKVCSDDGNEMGLGILKEEEIVKNILKAF